MANELDRFESPGEPTARTRHGTIPVLSAPNSLLADSRRRCVLRSLSEFAYPVELATIARRVGAFDVGCDPESLPERTVERVSSVLAQFDVPELDAAGLLEYDPESRMAVSTDTGRLVLAEGTRFVPE